MHLHHVRAVTVVFILLTGCASAPHPALLPVLSPAQPAIRDDYLLKVDAERIQLTRDYLAVHHPELARGLPTEDEIDSIFMQPRIVVVHYTAIPTLDQVMDYFRPNQIEGGRQTIRNNGPLNVGVQFVVDRDGTIYRAYPENVIARHTIGLNHVAIGIENVGDGDLEDSMAAHPLTRAQLAANLALIRYLAGKHPTLDYVIGHSEYRELEEPSHPAHSLFHEEIPAYRTEKVDPGEQFMGRLRHGLASSR